jgi:hypothetical protein
VPRFGAEVTRSIVRVVCAIAILMGGVFFFQGIGVLPGSFMTGRSEWSYIGGALVAAGGLGLWLARGRGETA